MPAMGSQAAAVLAIHPTPSSCSTSSTASCSPAAMPRQLFRRLEGPRRCPCDALDALGGDDASTRTRDPETVVASCVPDSPDRSVLLRLQLRF